MGAVGHRLRRTLEAIKQNRCASLGGMMGGPAPGYIDNVVDGLWLTRSSAAVGGTFNLCDDRSVTYREFYLAYARMAWGWPREHAPAWTARLAWGHGRQNVAVA